MMRDLMVAAVQMVSSLDAEKNIATMQNLVKQAAEQGADWILLPEYWSIMGRHDSEKVALAEPLGHGRFQVALSQCAAQHGVVLFGGSIPLRSSQPDKVLNTMLVYGRQGELLSQYDKKHLFGYRKGDEHYSEADSIISGSLVPQLNCEGWGVAQGICYDLRFPEFFRMQAPFEVLMLPAAFTYTTGLAHWRLLLQARAVENQCFVVAAAQGGKHENGRRTFGHSLIIDPWGEILAELPEGEGVVCAKLSRVHLDEIRAQLPALQHRQL